MAVKNGIPKWAKWQTRDPDGWLTYYQEKPHFQFSATWGTAKGKQDLSNTYFEEMRRFPKWFWRNGLFWSIVSMFTRRKIRRAR